MGACPLTRPLRTDNVLAKRRRVRPLAALLYWCRRLRIRWEMRDEIHEAFLSLAAALICWRRLTC